MFELPLEPPEPKCGAVCENCGEGIYVGQKMYKFHGACYDEDCFEEIAKSALLEEGDAHESVCADSEEDCKYCACCNDAIDVGEAMVELDGKYYHERCFAEAAPELIFDYSADVRETYSGYDD
jgi:hypothetical protein